MQIASGTYRLGTLRTIELKEAPSAEIEVKAGTNALLAETLFADADGWIRIVGFSDLLKPYCKVGNNAITVKVDDTTYTLNVTYNLLTNGENATQFDDTLDGQTAHEGIAPIRIFSFVNADGVTDVVNIFGVESEQPEIEAEYGTVKGVEKLTEARYSIKHEITTGRLSGREVKVLTGLLTSESVFLRNDNDDDDDNQVIIDVDADLVKWLNNPQEDRVARFSWRYADYNKAHSEYDDVFAKIDNSRNAEYCSPSHIFVFGDNSLWLWGAESQKREYDTSIVMRNGVQGDVDKHYRIAYGFVTDRMSRNELRALVLMATSSTVTVDGEAVVIKDLQVTISSDPQSDRTASFTWYYADVRKREKE